jgi:hypothetical protein
VAQPWQEGRNLRMREIYTNNIPLDSYGFFRIIVFSDLLLSRSEPDNTATINFMRKVI